MHYFRLMEVFSECEKVSSIRLIRRGMSQLHKGYGYVEFESSASVERALRLDRRMIRGRPMFVSEYKPHEKGQKAQFKFGSGLQKNKLFLSNLHYDTTVEQLKVSILSSASKEDSSLEIPRID